MKELPLLSSVHSAATSMPRAEVSSSETEVLPVAALPPPGTLPREKRVYLEVFGCQMNKLDGELMMAVLSEEGYGFVDRPEDAGVILYNTCAVREHAETRVFSKVGALRALKSKHPETVIGVLGCSAQNHGEAIFKRYPHVGIVCGPGEFLRLRELIEDARRGARATALSLENEPRLLRRKNFGPAPFQAYVSVMRGCDQACTFCIVPRTRGRELSRPVRDIIDECRALVDDGVREITLLGQTVNSYGKRLAKGRAIGLHHVLHEMQKIEGLDRIRFITSHPRFMRPELTEAMATLPKVCEYLHLPVQSGSSTVLARMLRGYDAEEYRGIVARLRERIPHIGLATDAIVGFSGETEEEFQGTVRLFEDVRFQSAYIFKYSVRSGTRAAECFADDVPERVKRERNQILLRLQGVHSLERNRARIGRVDEVLVEGPSRLDKARWTGRSRASQIVVFPRRDGERLEGKLIDVRITDATPLVLVGEAVGEGR
jgi:tRNA-2-methylthio-N6-dimethylallyladenosine synthase